MVARLLGASNTPSAVPENNEEVSKILKLCNKYKTPVVPFGTGTSLEGHVVGNKDGITISLEKMNKVSKGYNFFVCC